MDTAKFLQAMPHREAAFGLKHDSAVNYRLPQRAVAVNERNAGDAIGHVAWLLLQHLRHACHGLRADYQCEMARATRVQCRKVRKRKCNVIMPCLQRAVLVGEPMYRPVLFRLRIVAYVKTRSPVVS